VLDKTASTNLQIVPEKFFVHLHLNSNHTLFRYSYLVCQRRCHPHSVAFAKQKCSPNPPTFSSFFLVYQFSDSTTRALLHKHLNSEPIRSV
jgi:hypothetical protein